MPQEKAARSSASGQQHSGGSRAVALLSALAALASGWHAFALANRNARFPLVIAIAPSEPIALARAASLLAAQEQEGAGRTGQIAAMARRSLSGLALNPVALRLLALTRGPKLGADIDGQLVALASEVSRRDIGTQALRIQLAGRANDLAAVLAAYDVILRNGDGDPEQFFAPMTKALELPQMAPFFARYLRERTPWIPSFLVYAIPRSDKPQQIVSALEAGGGLVHYVDGPSVEIMLINRMIQLGQFRQAAAFYRSTAGFKPAVLTSPAIGPDSLVPRENGLLWFLYPKDGPIAETVADRAIVLYADPGQSGEVARKLLFLRPGQYRLTMSYEQVDLSGGAEVEWTGRCLSGTDVRPLWTLARGERSGSGAGRDGIAFTVPRDCGVFDLALAIQARDARRTVSATISQVALARASRDPRQ